jgi:hypothetical protein
LGVPQSFDTQKYWYKGPYSISTKLGYLDMGWVKERYIFWFWFSKMWLMHN